MAPVFNQDGKLFAHVYESSHDEQGRLESSVVPSKVISDEKVRTHNTVREKNIKTDNQVLWSDTFGLLQDRSKLIKLIPWSYISFSASYKTQE